MPTLHDRDWIPHAETLQTKPYATVKTPQSQEYNANHNRRLKRSRNNSKSERRVNEGGKTKTLKRMRPTENNTAWEWEHHLSEESEACNLRARPSRFADVQLWRATTEPQSDRAERNA